MVRLGTEPLTTQWQDPVDGNCQKSVPSGNQSSDDWTDTSPKGGPGINVVDPKTDPAPV
jgi:hypothetical protein